MFARRALALTALVVLLGGSSWIEGVEDLPLMPQLTRAATPPVVFDKPEGRIVQASAEGLVPATDVRRFYESTLPQLGWIAAGPLAWVRGKEKLTIELHTTATRTSVRFTVAPERKAGERE